MTQMLESLMLGAVAMGSLVASLFFLRFRVRTRDSFFPVLFSSLFDRGGEPCGPGLWPRRQ